jgi:hypothetical protein
MKKIINLPNIIWPFVVISLLFLNQCGKNESSVYSRIRDHADRIKVINTHEHQHWPEEYGDYNFRFYHLIAASYLASDISSAGANAYDWKLIDSLSLDELWDVYGKALDYTRSTSYYSHFVKGLRKLYDFEDLYFTKDNIAKLSARIEKNYNNYKSWFDESFKKTGYELMFIDQFWKPFNTELDNKYFALVFNINELISESSQKPDKGAQLKSIYKEADNSGFTINDLDGYLEFCNYLFKKNIENKAVCIKNSQAYTRTLFYEDIPYEEAKVLFNKPSSDLTPAEAKKIEDFMFHWIIQKAIKYDLPIQIHTGYLAGNGNVLDNGQPIKLNNLFLKYPDAKFDLFHGGFPWTDEIAALGKMFPNVYINIVWLPQISREKAVSALDVMFDCIPYNKFFWGGDCGLIEESVGSLEYAKDVVSEVLAKRVERGLLTEDVAFDINIKIFRENAVKVFMLKERLGREFK